MMAEPNGSANDIDDWNFLSLSETNGSSDNPSMQSSCEFVSVERNNGNNTTNDKDIQLEPTPVDHDGDSELQFSGDLNEPVEDKDMELRRLMDILHKRVRSASPCPSSSTESDFVQIASSDHNEPSDHSPNSLANSRFSIVFREESPVRRIADDLKWSKNEQHFEIIRSHDPDDDDMPDADDRVESDIVNTLHVAEGENSQSSDESLTAPLIRHYRHSPNRDLNTLLTTIALTALGFAIGIAIGHAFGSDREAQLQQQIQEGQRIRLRSVQDDLLMCLRKQEDIDQTINKLNEIENILVDAEHWRNEYEELLNVKLKNEEGWRKESLEMQSTMKDLEKSHNQLLQTKSCAHDNEFLSRQETTLNSVHEKLEANLLEKDRTIETLQAQVTECKVVFSSTEKISDAYKKSDEEKSLVILQLKEQMLKLEHQIFDMKVEAPLESQDWRRNPKIYAHDATGVEVKKTESDLVLNEESSRPEKSNSTVLDESSVDGQSVAPLHEIKVSENEAKVSENEVNVSESMETCYSQLEDLKQENELLKQELMTIKMRLNASDGQNTSMPCITFNLCDKLKVNLTSSQLLRLYKSGNTEYKYLQKLVLSEFRNLTDQILGPPSVVESKDIKTDWDSYLNATKESVGQILESVNSSWRQVKQISQQLIAPKLEENMRNMEKKMSKNIDKLTKGFQKGIDAVVRSVNHYLKQKTADDSSKDREYSEESILNESSEAANEDSQESSAESDNQSEDRKEFTTRFDQLRKDLEKLDVWLVNKMRKYEKENLYELFDDFKDNYSYMFKEPDLQWAKSWVDCQLSWWKQKASGREGLWEVDDECSGHLMSWQLKAQYTEDHQQRQDSHRDDLDKSSWLYKRAEERDYQRREPDTWYWRRSHDYDATHSSHLSPGDVPFPRDEL